MPRKLAIDWDESELRLVAAQCSGRSVKVTDAEVIPLDGRDVGVVLADVLQRRGLEKTETFVAIGRDKAELRDLQLPPVPDEELPDMVRFKAISSFASAGDSATIDFLVTQRTDRGVELIAAAIAPAKLDSVRQVCAAANLPLKRIALRPLGAAALYLGGDKMQANDGEVVLIDLLASDAEIVVAREAKVIFVRTVKLPNSPQARPAALAGELRRSLVAAGSSGSPKHVVLWGRESIHHDELEQIAQVTQCDVRTINPFDLVDVDASVQSELPQHCGRLAPLVGLLASDEAYADRLIDFLNPRRRPEEAPNHLKTLLAVGIPIAAVLLLGMLIYKQFRSLDSQIAGLKQEINDLQPRVKDARTSIDRTDRVDQFLDGDVNWLAELRRLSEVIPPADQLILNQVTGTSDTRGGGRLKLIGAVTDPAVLQQFESAVRDENHTVVGQGSSEQKTESTYRWTFTETVSVGSESVRNERYQGLAPRDESVAETASDEPSAATEAVNADETPADEIPASETTTPDIAPETQA